MPGECVKYPPHRIHFKRNTTCGTFLRPLEEKMLDEMRHAVYFGSFMTRSVGDPDPD